MMCRLKLQLCQVLRTVKSCKKALNASRVCLALL